MSLVFLIGMPGVGKTFWGRIWAAASDYDFVDLDEDIETQAGVSIADIFCDVGEDGFRALETTVLRDTIAAARGRNTIIATGGGTPVFSNNMDAMLESGFVVYLKADIETLLKQIAGSEVLRPLLQHSDPDAAVLEGLLKRRAPFYERAHLSVAVENLRTDTFAQILKECTSRQS